jgi:hypothetical protein
MVAHVFSKSISSPWRPCVHVQLAMGVAGVWRRGETVTWTPTYPAWRADALPAPSCDHGAQGATLVDGTVRGSEAAGRRTRARGSCNVKVQPLGPACMQMTRSWRLGEDGVWPRPCLSPSPHQLLLRLFSPRRRSTIDSSLVLPNFFHCPSNPSSIAHNAPSHLVTARCDALRGASSATHSSARLKAALLHAANVHHHTPFPNPIQGASSMCRPLRVHRCFASSTRVPAGARPSPLLRAYLHV